MRMERIWAMPNKWTFAIKPIDRLLREEMGKGVWVDPFAGVKSPATITNDLNPERPTNYHMDALAFLKTFADNSVDGVLYDPPYSQRQVKECYDGIQGGLEMGRANDLLERDKERGGSYPETGRKGHLLWLELYGVGGKAWVYHAAHFAGASWRDPK